MWKETPPNCQAFSRKLRAFEQHIRELQPRTRNDQTEQQEFSAQVLEELQVALEELRVAEEELQQQNEELLSSQQIIEEERRRYHDLFELAPDGYVVTDVAGIVEEANRAAATLLGVPQRALKGKPLVLYLAQENHAAFYSLLQQLARDEGIHTWEATVRSRSVESIPVSVRVAQRHTRHESVGGFRWVLRDITEQIEAKKHLRTLNSSLEARVQQRTTELQRSNEALQQFASVVSHDLQEPLRMVQTYVELLANRYRDHLDSQANEYIGYAVDGASRMQQLIRDLLNYSRVETRTKELIETDCEEVLARVLKSLRIVIAESGAVVTHDPLPVVRGDSMQLSQVLQNLLSNALKFHGQEPPRIHIAAERGEYEWIFSVRDNGIGIDPTQAERIFVIFQRLHTRDQYPGTGLGLAICRKIIERHGGRIWVRSEPGQGATFYFTLPTEGMKN